MKIHVRHFFAFTLIVAALGSAKGQSIPTDNPLRTRYGAMLPAAPFHWTDSINWGNVVNIQSYANLVQRIDDPGEEDEAYLQNDWLPAFNAAQNALVASGGGVIYFPPLPQKYDGEGGIDPGKDSAYFFSDHILLKSNVILRGATPPNLDARQPNFTPPSFIEFPRYRGGTSVSVPNSTSFKEITVDTAGIVGIGKPGFKNIGVVYLDVNRGRFAAHPTFRKDVTPNGTFGIANEKPRNVLILGMRSNNVAIPDLNIPNSLPDLPAATDRLAKRWSWRFAANIDVYVSANCIVAGCRLNDYLNNNGRGNLRRILDNSFNQSNYIPNAASNEPPCFPTPDQAKFDYNAHYGIIVNKLKKSGYNTTEGFRSNASPQEEPELYAPGNWVLDNWIFKNSRVAIHAAGNGLVVKGNVTKDDPSKQVAIGPTGATCLRESYPPANTPTFENRGIDISGWNVLVDSNTVEAFRHRLLPSNVYSGDGEGWYFQGPSGSTARDITISNNRYIGSSAGFCDAVLNTNTNKGFNGFTNTTSIQNVRVFNNDNGGIPFRIESSGTPPVGYIVRGLRIYNNTNLHSIRVRAAGCGDSSFVYNNAKGGGNPACGLQDLDIDCFTSINADFNQRNENSNTGFQSFPANPNGDDRPNCQNACPNGGPTCGFPSSTITDIGQPCFVAGQQVLVSVAYNLANCAPDSIVLFRGSGIRVEKVSSGLISGSGETIFTSYTAPTSGFAEPIYTIAYKEGYTGQSASRLVKICVSNAELANQSNEIALFPNPATSEVQLKWAQAVEGMQIRALSLEGKVWFSQIFGGTQARIAINQLPKGLYILELKAGNKLVRKRLMVN